MSEEVEIEAGNTVVAALERLLHASTASAGRSGGPPPFMYRCLKPFSVIYWACGPPAIAAPKSDMLRNRDVRRWRGDGCFWNCNDFRLLFASLLESFPSLDEFGFPLHAVLHFPRS